MAWLLDSDVFIQAKNLHYGFDFCPAFWDWLIRENNTDQVFSIERVGDELKAGEDELSAWARDRGDSFFLPPGPTLTTSLQAVSEWTTRQRFEQSAVSTFLQVADYYLIAQAHEKQYTVVTHEVPANSVHKIKIPNVCIGLGIKCVNPYEMLRSERARFVLGIT